MLCPNFVQFIKSRVPRRTRQCRGPTDARIPFDFVDITLLSPNFVQFIKSRVPRRTRQCRDPTDIVYNLTWQGHKNVMF